MENNYCASVRSCEQVSPDDWEMITRTLKVDENTTMKQIADWHKNLYPQHDRMHIIITNLDNPHP